MIQAKQNVFLKNRKSTKGTGTYKSGWMLVDEYLALGNLAKQAGLTAIGFNITEDVKTAKFDGDIIAMVPFKLASKSA